MKKIIIMLLFVFSGAVYGQELDRYKEKEPFTLNINGGLNSSYNIYGESIWIQPSAGYLSFSSNKTGNWSLGLFYAPGPTALTKDFNNGGYPGYFSVGISYNLFSKKIRFRRKK